MNSCMAGGCRREADDSIRIKPAKKDREKKKQMRAGPSSQMEINSSANKQDDDSFVDLGGDDWDDLGDEDKGAQNDYGAGSDQEALDMNAMTLAQAR